MVSHVSWANLVGNDTQNFNPTSGGLDFVTVHSSETLSSGFLNSGLFYNQASNVLPDSLDSNGNTVKSKDRISFGDVNFGYGFTNQFEMGFNFSYLLSQQIDRNAPGAQFTDTGLNEVRVSAKYKVKERQVYGMALIASLNMNQAQNNPFAGAASGPTVNFEGAFDRKFEDTLVAVNLGYRIRSRGSAIPNAIYEPLPNQYIASFGISHYFPDSDLKWIGEVLVSKPTESVRYLDSSRIASEALTGFKYDALSTTSVHAGAGTRLSNGLFTPDWRIYIGVNFSFELLKKREPAPAEIVVSPVSPTIQLYEGYQQDEIESMKDMPFDELAKKYEFRLRKTVPEKDFNGDKPPFEAIRLDHFDFDFGSAQIRPENYPMLNDLASYLASKPEVLKIRVEGHTDSVGSSERNKLRSQQRADAVKKYLKGRGVLPQLEMEAVGYGAERPIAENGNFQGRKQNRRVEIRILRQIVPRAQIIK